MKSTILALFIIALFAFKINAQDTFSLVAADSATREVGSAGASCVDLFSAGILDATFIGDLLPDTGAINSQAYYLAANQTNARIRMRAGDTPAQIIDWLIANDVQSNSPIRQYGVVGFTGNNVSSVGFTGTNCQNYKNHRTGSINGIYYSIQGNILLGQVVIDSIESRFRNAQGDLACRLMAGLQGAKMVGADTRCTNNGSSSLFAFVKVAQPTDTYGYPSFKVSVKTHNGAHIEPIDTLQTVFNAQHICGPIGIVKTPKNEYFSLYPNPADNTITLKTNPSMIGSEYLITDQLGRIVKKGVIISRTMPIDIQHLHRSIYFIQLDNLYRQKFIKN